MIRAETCLLGRKSGGQDAAHRPDPTVQPQLAQQGRSTQLRGTEDPLCREYGGDDREIVVTAGLRQGSRAEIDGQ